MPGVRPTPVGYVSDVAYPLHFHREMTPVWLCAVLTALGRRGPDLVQPFVHLDLGCGRGLNTLVAAAAHPQGRFIAIDADAEAIAQARAMADAAGLDNIEFHALDFEAASRRAWPALDFVVTHGVYSWVGPQARRAMRQIALQHLAPGGVFHVAYASAPGASAFAAAQRLMVLSSRTAAGDSAARARTALDLLQHMAQAGAGAFVEHPSLQRELAQMALTAQSQPAQLAHEYLNAHREALHVADVMADFAAIGCDYAGSATPVENIDAVSLPAPLQPLLAERARAGADPAELETFKDIARNQNLRRDIYQRPGADGRPALLTPEQHRQALLAQRVGLLPAAPAGRLTGELVFDTRIGPVRLAAGQVAPLLGALQPGPRSYAELARLPAHAAQPGFLNPLLQVLMYAGWLHPLQPGADVTTDSPSAQRVRRLNDSLRSWPVPAGGRVHAAAPIGSACAIEGPSSAQACRWLGLTG